MAEISDQLSTSVEKMWISKSSLAIFVGVSVATITYYLSHVVKKPVLITGSKSCADFLQHHCPVLVQEYYPTVWCFTSRAHTILCSVLSDLTRWKLPPYRREVLDMPDGGELHLDWLEHHGNSHYNNSHHDNRTHPIIVILPGMSGNSRSHYVINLARGASKKGYRSVVYNHRGSNGVKLKNNKYYCAADTSDLQHVVTHIRKLYPDAPLMAAGVSLGGMITFNYLAKFGKDCGLVAAMVMSMPWNTFKTTESLEEPLNRLLFNKYLTFGLTQYVRQNREVFDKDSRVDVDHALKSSTIAEYDKRFTIKVFGFESVDQFYTLASACYKVSKVQTPLLSLNAADDVFAPLSSIPTKEIEKNPNIALVVTSHGGHIGFGDWLFPSRESFMDKLYQQYVDAVFKYRQEEHVGTQKKREWENREESWVTKVDPDTKRNLEKERMVGKRVSKSPGGKWPCPVCARVCGSRIGLYSHQRIHENEKRKVLSIQF
ncbi:phospholipase ABHD3-like [Branchiostoma floridae]|uniref:Phospholipase ABHD3 n=1 Tax=Branchiostoma floridae TaxID=7739 RepID=A0A9J7KIC6_BRAFL|nr:phospholipase ABHD3-like [Branchiostoma floridae]